MRGVVARPWVRQLLILAGFLAAGIAAIWPRPAYLTGTLPHGIDEASYVWSFWWVAHQVTHLANPWVTHYLAAPGLPLRLPYTYHRPDGTNEVGQASMARGSCWDGVRLVAARGQC